MPSQNTEDPTANQGVNHSVNPIVSTDELRAILGKPAKALEKRVQTTLDHYAIEFIEQASTAVLATADATQPMHFVDCKRENPFIVDHQRLSLSTHFTGKVRQEKSDRASLYFFVVAIGHSLRVNGKLIKTESDTVEFHIDTLYFHCARAAARSQLWQPPAPPHDAAIGEITSQTTAREFLQQSPFVLMKTLSCDGATEISPRGDGAGFVHQIGDNTLLIPERPGNKMAVSLNNLIDRPEIELLCLVPGCHWVFNIIGQAVITSTPTLLKHCTVKGKQPKLGIVIEITSASIQQDAALSNLKLWDSNTLGDERSLTPFSKALSAHINGTGLLGKITSGVVKAVVNHDMKNLY